MDFKFAAFIMTFNRHEIILDTIEKILVQTYPPQKILVVDNSPDFETEEVIKNYGNPIIEYFHVGYNSGPAGAAKIGLEILTEQGYDWIYWGDDDDPPRGQDAFNSLFHLIERSDSNNLGAVALMGNNFSIKSAKIKLIPINKLKGVISVNSLAGGSTMLINSQAIKKGVLPDANLFFGFEELDFCLSLKKFGYNILIDGDYYFKLKSETGFIKNKKSSLINKNFTREYYSLRNLIIIVYHKHKSIQGLIFILIRNILKIPFNFKYGISYGLKSSKNLVKAINDGLTFKN